MTNENSASEGCKGLMTLFDFKRWCLENYKLGILKLNEYCWYFNGYILLFILNFDDLYYIILPNVYYLRRNIDNKYGKVESLYMLYSVIF